MTVRVICESEGDQIRELVISSTIKLSLTVSLKYNYHINS